MISEITIQPTHTSLGVKTFICSECSAVKTEDVAKLLNHTYGSWQKHDEDQHKKSCECGDIQYVKHTWDEGVITSSSTSTELAIKTYNCTLCCETKTEQVMDKSYLRLNDTITSNKFTCDMYFDNTFVSQSAVVAIAFYEESGKMLNLASTDIFVNVGKVPVEIPVKVPGYDYYKVFVWNSLSTLKPLCEAEVIRSSEFIIE